MDQAAAGKKALAEGNYATAITSFTAALKTSPTSPTYLIDRSTAHHRAKDYPAALSDANAAVINAQKRAKRELIIEAQFRRGCALYCLERYADAEFVFAVVRRMNEGHKMVGVWIQKTSVALGKLEMGDERGVLKVKETPEEVEESVMGAGSDAASSYNEAASTTTTTNGNASTATKDPASTSTAITTSATPAPQPQQTPPDKIRHEWYQNSNNIYFTLLAKGVPAAQTQIDINSRSLAITFPLTTGSNYDLTLDPLFGAIDPAKSSSRVLSTKIEVVLAKSVPGVKWGALEGVGGEGVDVDKIAILPSTTSAVAGEENTIPSARAPMYPTSSRSGPKDWDKITAASLAAAKSSTSTSASSSAGTATDTPASSVVATDNYGDDDDDDVEGGDEANAFFKKLFKNASPEVQRAMMKSYTESNGTALSTNWEEVKKGKVETTPPDGMVAKKW